ncbi:MAG: hypothetical protein IIX93_06300 [Clostridia bacterium]|nr:hypothetical protein [Clostridia bacterium]
MKISSFIYEPILIALIAHEKNRSRHHNDKRDVKMRSRQSTKDNGQSNNADRLFFIAFLNRP